MDSRVRGNDWKGIAVRPFDRLLSNYGTPSLYLSPGGGEIVDDLTAVTDIPAWPHAGLKAAQGERSFH